MKTVTIKVDAKGKVVYESKGYVGTECKEVQKVMLGIGQVSDVKDTADAYKSNERPAYNELGYH
jgi:hypothetical protein